jgi:GNAT superfamily N-acetyltransferase
MDIQFRTARAEDISALRELIPLAADALSQGYYTDQQIRSAITHIFGVDSQLVTDQTYYVAVAGSQIVACGGWSKRSTLFGGDQMKGEDDDFLDPARDSARIRAFFVHPEWARRGIGRRLIEMSEDAAREAGFTRMEMGATLPGEPLYAAMGYEVSDRFDIEMPDGVTLPCAHMTKELASRHE